MGDYKGAAKNREFKLRRAIESVLSQTYSDFELILVSDGCFRTSSMHFFEYKENSKIRLVQVEKQPLFSGNVREAGVKAAVGDNILYLDNDDFYAPDHVANVAYKLDNEDFVYWNDSVYFGEDEFKRPVYQLRETELKKNYIGTSCIAHKRIFANGYKPSWVNCDGYGHDFVFIKKMMLNTQRVKKITDGGYRVCHVPNVIDI